MNSSNPQFAPPRAATMERPRPGQTPAALLPHPPLPQSSAAPLDRRTLLRGTAVELLTPRAQSMDDHVLPRHNNRAPTLPPLSVIAFNRMGFGPRPTDWALWQSLGATDEARLTAYVDEQLNPAAINDSDCDARLASNGFVTLNKSLRQLWEDHVTNNTGGGYEWYVRPADETVQATWLRAIYSKRQLLEVLADFWHNHFNVYAFDQAAPIFTSFDRDVIRAHALGNFRTLLEAVGSHPAMLFYLDNYISSDGGPNENYARELFELHAMGADAYLGHLNQGQVPLDPQGRPIAYVDEDVYEAARAFTGWTINGAHWELPAYDPGPPERYVPGTFLTWDDWHDRFQKHILGNTIPSNQGTLPDGRAVFDLLAAHPATARHVCTKLCRRLIADDPPQAVIDAAVAVWQANLAAPDQLKRVVRTILLSPEFKTTWGQKVKRPLELVVSVLRGVNATWSPDWDWQFYWWVAGLGQRVFEWPAPNGHPDTATAWTSTSVMLQRWNVTAGLLENWVGNSVQVDLLAQMPATQTSANQIVDWWSQRLLGRALDAADRAEIVAFMAQGFAAGGSLPADQIADRLPSTVQLICMAPDFQYR
ncbi:MAG: DUF1800 domain-containing protein [Anaerolineae bacterium]